MLLDVSRDKSFWQCCTHVSYVLLVWFFRFLLFYYFIVCSMLCFALWCDRSMNFYADCMHGNFITGNVLHLAQCRKIHRVRNVFFVCCSRRGWEKIVLLFTFLVQVVMDDAMTRIDSCGGIKWLLLGLHVLHNTDVKGKRKNSEVAWTKA